ENIYEYADRALHEFFTQAATAPWFKNTVFVILGDHGQRFDPLYEVPLSYHHIPLIIHGPGASTHRTHHGFGTQVDIGETILGMLRLPHVNNTLGSDLLRTEQPCAYFCSDDLMGAVNERFFWVRSGGIERLYDYPTRSTVDVSARYPGVMDSLRTRTHSMVQAAQWMVDEKMVGEPVLLLP
ncbi:MAG TPA: sulfatase-like hydrolase/transferase, partial [Flavobacteriales bacterium]|nr:sulfatase-like hydrolase/transferase [Flavobacteriales bacterium]